jgi:hypothetical protein
MLFQHCLSLAALVLPLLNAHMLPPPPAADVSQSAASSTITSAPIASASSTAESACSPVDSQGNPVMNAPCNVLANITALCSESSDGGAASPAEEQNCYCGSGGEGLDFWEDLAG